MMIQTKLCVLCGKEFSKPYNCSKKEWSQRKFCSADCQNKSRRGKPSWNKDKETNQIPWNKGKINCYSEETKKLMGADKVGKTTSDFQKQRVSESNRGERSHLWKGGITPLNKAIRTSTMYSNWRNQVFGRDNFTCQECGARGVWLEAHHIKSFSSLIGENKITTLEQAMQCNTIWDISNGKTLCKVCHKEKTFN